MQVVKYFLLTDTHYENPNPGDILIGKGIEYLLYEAEYKINNRFAIFNYVNLFNLNDKITWNRMLEEADVIVLCGTPQLTTDYIPNRFNQSFYDVLFKAKSKGIKIFNLWVGFVDQLVDRDLKKSVGLIINNHKNFILNNFKIYDLIITRDLLTQKVLENLQINSIQLADSVYFSPLYYKINENFKEFNILVLKDLNTHNKFIVNVLYKIAKNKFKNLLCLCHDIHDYNVFKSLLDNVICINNPKNLLEFYSKAKNVISFRVHGTIPSLYFGANTLHISYDSRSLIVKYLFDNISTIRNMYAISNERDIKLDNLPEINHILKFEKNHFFTYFKNSFQL